MHDAAQRFEPYPAHIRSPLWVAAPLFRLRRLRAQESEASLPGGAERQPTFGLLSWIHGADRAPGKVQGVGSGSLHQGSLDHHICSCVFPQRDKQFASERHDRRLPETAAVVLHPFLEPAGKRRARLIPGPEPGQLDHGRSQAAIAGLGDALLLSDRSALPGGGSKSGIGCQLAPVIKMAEQPFFVEDGGELRADALEVERHGCRRVGSLRREERSALVLDDFDLFDDQLEPVELSIDLRSDVSCQNASIAGSELFEPFTPVAT